MQKISYFNHLPTRQIWLTMKLTIVLLLSVFLQVSATGYSQTVNFSGKDVPIKKVFSVIKNQTGAVFFYDAALLLEAKPVTVKLQNVSLEEALNEIFKGQPLSWVMENKTITIIKKQLPVIKTFTEQAIAVTVIKGRVVNENGVPVPGATVLVKGTKNATSTNADGFFELNGLDVNATLIISGTNIQTKEIKTGSKTFLAISVTTKLVTESDVTVSTGYQKISKERSAGSFSKPDMDIVNSRTTSGDILQRLDGLVPGLVLNKGNVAVQNNKTGSYFSVMLRGAGTIYGNSQPLYVVDGVPIDDFSTINPNDVQDITILKDATAASIWGSRASNGVIVVTMKSGRNSKKQGVNVAYDGYLNLMGKPDIGTFPEMNSQQYIQAMQEIYNTPNYISGQYSWRQITKASSRGSLTSIRPDEYLLYGMQNSSYIPQGYAGSTLASLASFNNVQQMKDLWYRNASVNHHTLSISGSSGKYSIYGSLGYTGNIDATPGDKNNTYKVNIRQDVNFNKNFQLYLITDLTDNISSSKNAITPDNRFVPYASFLGADGKPQNMNWLYMNDSLINQYQIKSQGIPVLGSLNLNYNPGTDYNTAATNSNNFNTRITSGFNLHLYKNLRLEGVYGAIIGNTQYNNYQDISNFQQQVFLGQHTIADPITPLTPVVGGTYAQTNTQQKSWTVRHQLVFDQNWQNGKHQLTILAGTETRQQTTSLVTTTIRGYDQNLLTNQPVDYLSLSTNGYQSTIIGPYSGNAGIDKKELYNESYVDSRFRSYYGNAAYTYLAKYTINASTRYDKSNLFGTDQAAQSKPVLAVGVAWLVSKEKFLSNVSWLNRLAIRATYGTTGNAPIPGTGSSYDIAGVDFAGSGLSNPALVITSPANKALTWESTKTYNFGIDYAVLKSRLSGSLDIYSKHTANALGYTSFNPTAGYTNVFGNGGDITNKGIELSIKSVNVANRNFSWVTQFNLAYNKGKIVKVNYVLPVISATDVIGQPGLNLANNSLINNPQTMGFVQGYQPFTVFAYNYAGLSKTGDPQIKLADGTITTTPSVAKLADLKNMGSYVPLIKGGFTNIFRYKEFSLVTNIIYNLDYVLNRDANSYYTARITSTDFNSGNLPAEFAKRWKKIGDEAVTNIPAYRSALDAQLNPIYINYYTAGDINVIKGDYIKMRDITIAYELPKGISNKLKADNIVFRVQVNNIMLWKANNAGIDPEFFSEGGFGGRRITPIGQHSITFGLHVGF